MNDTIKRSSTVVAKLSCRPLYQLSRDDAAGVWRPDGPDPQFLVPLGDVCQSPGLYRLSVEIGKVGVGIEPCIYLASGDTWSEASRIALRSPLGDGVWSAVIDIADGVRDLRLDPVNEQVEFELGAVQLQKLDDVEAAAFLIHAFVGRHENAQVSRALKRMNAVIASGDMAAVRKLLMHGEDSGAAADGCDTPDDLSYANWAARYDSPGARELARMTDSVGRWPRRPLISIVMPVYNTDERWLRRSLDAVRAQAYPDWELCIADDASTVPDVRAVLEEYVARDSRIKVIYRKENGHISAASNSALELVTGPLVALLDHDDELAPHALFHVAMAVLAHPEARLFYSDEDKIDESGDRHDPYFKPDWNPDLFLSQNFISHLGVYETALIRQVGGFRNGYEGSQDYDLALRCIAQLKSDQIVHIPHVLYHWRAIRGSTALRLAEKSYAVEAGRKALLEHFQRAGETAKVEVLLGGYRVRRTLPNPVPSIEIIITTHGRVDLLRACVGSILDKSSYDNFSVTVIDNQSVEKKTLCCLEEIVKDKRVKILSFDALFNYSSMNNVAAAHSKADLIVLLNGSAEVIAGDWLEEMAVHAMRSDVGAVGAKLYYPNGTIQHAGIVLGLCGVADHIYRGEPHDAIGQMGRALLTQNYSAVTGACLMLRRANFDEVGGLNDRLQVAYADIDLCLKLRARGYWNVWTPFAELFQHEFVDRGREDTDKKMGCLQEDVTYMHETWGQLLNADPAYSLNLSLQSKSCELAFPPRAWSPLPGDRCADDSRTVRSGVAS